MVCRRGKGKEIRYSEGSLGRKQKAHWVGWCVRRKDYRVHEKKVRNVFSSATGGGIIGIVIHSFRDLIKKKRHMEQKQ